MRGRITGAVAVAGLLLAACGPSAEEQARQALDRGRAALKAGQYEAAVEELKKSVGAKPTFEGHLLLGNAYRGRRQWQPALAAYREAKQLDRYRLEPHVEEGVTRLEMGETEAAIWNFLQVIELDPTSVEAMYLLGKAYRKERHDLAEVQLRRAVELRPDFVEAHYELAKVYETLGRRDRARESWEQVRRLAGQDPKRASLAAEAASALRGR